MNNFELIKTMTPEELASFLYIHLSRKGLKKTKEWLLEDVKENEQE